MSDLLAEYHAAQQRGDHDEVLRIADRIKRQVEAEAEAEEQERQRRTN